MKPRKAIRIGVLLVVAVALVSTWALVSAANGQLATVTANSTATYDRLGVATVGGTLSCAGLGTLQVNGNLQQPVGLTKSVVGTFNKDFSCGPGAPTGWSAQVVPQSGKFGAGNANLTVFFNGSLLIGSASYYPPYPNCYFVYYDYTTNTNYYQCYVSGTIGPRSVRLSHN